MHGCEHKRPHSLFSAESRANFSRRDAHELVNFLSAFLGNRRHDARSPWGSNAFRLGSAGGRFRRCPLRGGDVPEAHCHHRSDDPRRQAAISSCCQPRTARGGAIPCQLCGCLRALGSRRSRGGGPGTGRAPLSRRRFCHPLVRRSPSATACEDSRLAPADSYGGRRFLSSRD